jgi:hypothetical protein
MTRTRLRPSPSMVVAFAALMVALGGTSYAVTQLPARSVGSKQLKRESVTRINLGRESVTGAKVARDAITGRHVNEATLGQVPSAALADRVANADHATSAAAVDKLTYRGVTETVRQASEPSTQANVPDAETFAECLVEAATAGPPPDVDKAKRCGRDLALPDVGAEITSALQARRPATERATATCDTGLHVVGGGVKVEDPETMAVVESYPDAGGRSWTARVRNEDTGGSHTFTVYAICVASQTTS